MFKKILFAVCATMLAFSQALALTQQQREAFIAYHNYARATVNPPAFTTIPGLYYDLNLEAQAQGWANACSLSHTTFEQRFGAGENLAWGTGLSAEVAAFLWLNEVNVFRYPGCSTGNWWDCGHYTQMIWSNTRSLGCASAQCGAFVYYVCRYQGPGNYIGQPPYQSAGGIGVDDGQTGPALSDEGVAPSDPNITPPNCPLAPATCSSNKDLTSCKTAGCKWVRLNSSCTEKRVRRRSKSDSNSDKSKKKNSRSD